MTFSLFDLAVAEISGSGVGVPLEMKKKPDALVILAVVFGLGVLVSSLTYGGNEARLNQMAASAGAKTLSIQR